MTVSYTHLDVYKRQPYYNYFTKQTEEQKYAPNSMMRDPSMTQGPDGTFHLVWTISWNGEQGFGYASSKDLIHWSEQREIKVMKDSLTNNVWAPEVFYDDEKEQFIVVWSSAIPVELSLIHIFILLASYSYFVAVCKKVKPKSCLPMVRL